ncbi:PIN domain-containing protein [Streptomyces sp. NPDC047081]|uniref:PIN domain-containing protein n=1 Tax=Streptomyces sp. NPDC047081 TaxID=3154706 RepID=UPI003401EC09
MILYLADSSAIWRLQREEALRDAWLETTILRAIGSCAPQRAEFRRSARNAAEYEAMGFMFADLYPDVPLPKRLWDWVEAAQFSLAERGAVSAASPLDLMICATAAHHGLTVLHDDHDFATVARFLPDVAVHNVRVVPGAR